MFKKCASSLFLILFAVLFIFITPTNIYAIDGQISPFEERLLWIDADSRQIEDDKDSQFTNMLFVQNDSYHPTRKGVIFVTPDKAFGLIPTGHAAIVYDAHYVIEALAGGVSWGKNDWNNSHSSYTAVTVNITSIEQDERAVNWCENQIGKPYNINFERYRSRTSFYCSQLIWAAYLDLYGLDLVPYKKNNVIWPVALVESDQTRVIFRHSR